MSKLNRFATNITFSHEKTPEQKKLIDIKVNREKIITVAPEGNNTRDIPFPELIRILCILLQQLYSLSHIFFFLLHYFTILQRDHSMKITRDMSILEALKISKNSAAVVKKYDLFCPSCKGAAEDTVQIVAVNRGIDLETLLAELNKSNPRQS